MGKIFLVILSIFGAYTEKLMGASLLRIGQYDYKAILGVM